MIRKISYKVVSVLYKAMINFIFALQNILSVTHNYQPNPFSKKNRAGRDTYDRYNAILSNINETPKSVIDLGCNRGFFVLKTAAEGSISIGVDHDWFEIIWARALAEKNNTSNALFMNAEINSSFLPSDLYVIFLQNSFPLSKTSRIILVISSACSSVFAKTSVFGTHLVLFGNISSSPSLNAPIMILILCGLMTSLPKFLGPYVISSSAISGVSLRSCLFLFNIC